MPDAAEPTIPPSQPSPGLKVATLGGVPVYIGRTWPVIAVIIVVTFGPSISRSRPDLGIRAYLVAAAFSVLLLVSVLAHEAAHAVVATRFGYRVNRVVADLWGGHTAYDTAQSRPGPSALVAVVGPAANGAIALAGWLLADRVPGGVPALLVGAVVWTNGFVALFNLLPGLPLDGGFLVDALVWRVTGNRDLGLIAAGWCGRVVTVLVLGWALLLPFLRGYPPSLFTVVWAGVIGAFLWGGADQRHPHRPCPERPGRHHHRVRVAPCQLPAGGQQRGRRLGAARQRPRRHRRHRGRRRRHGASAWSTTTHCSGSPRRHDRSPRSWPRSAGSQPGGSSTPSPTPPSPPWSRPCRRCRSAPYRCVPRSGRIEGIVLADDLEAALSRGAAART